ncbi:hypothetical protein, partial [Klebsiella pneumoniae]|uniref:hypothetical protein n=2 Tax=Klebsiella pneumoniae TaxID=573 RepID=UPI001D0F4387
LFNVVEKKQKKEPIRIMLDRSQYFIFFLIPCPTLFRCRFCFPTVQPGYIFLATTAHRKYLLNNKLNQYDR